MAQEVANLEVQSGTYPLKDATARNQIQNVITDTANKLTNKASARVWNVVTDGGADPTGSTSAQAVFDQILTMLNSYDYVYIPKGTYNLSKLFVCTEKVICDAQSADENPNSMILKYTPINYGSPSMTLYKQTEKPSDGNSFQGWCFEQDGDPYTAKVYAVNRNSSTGVVTLKWYDNFLNNTTAQTEAWGHGNSLTWMPTLRSNNGDYVYLVCPINGNNLLTYDAYNNVTNTVIVNGVNSQINIANKIGRTGHIVVQTEDNNIYICQMTGTSTAPSFTAVRSFPMSRPSGGTITGCNGIAYYKGNIYMGWSDQDAAYDYNRNWIQIWDLYGNLKAEYMLNSSYEAREIEGFNVIGNRIYMLEYGNNSVFTDYNSWSIWYIEPEKTGLQQDKTEIGFAGILGEQRLYVAQNGNYWGNGTKLEPFNYLQYAISYASAFQPVHIYGISLDVASYSGDIHIKNRSHYLKITGVQFKGKITVENCANVQFENCEFRYSGDYQITIDVSNVDFSGCYAFMTEGQSGNGWIRAVGNSNIELHNGCKVQARNAASLSRGAKFSFGTDTTGVLYNCIYNEGSISVGNVSKITHTYKSTVSNGGLDGIIE